MPTLKNIGSLATCKDEGGKGVIHPIKNAAVAWQDQTIQWVGKEKDLPEEYRNDAVFDADGNMVIRRFRCYKRPGSQFLDVPFSIQ